MLWDLIRDFFVQHVFGGTTSNNVTFSPFVGIITMYLNGEQDDYYLGTMFDLPYKLANTEDGYSYYMNLGDWLSTTATAIAITIIVVLCCMFVYKIVKLIGGLIR